MPSETFNVDDFRYAAIYYHHMNPQKNFYDLKYEYQREMDHGIRQVINQFLIDIIEYKVKVELEGIE